MSEDAIRLRIELYGRDGTLVMICAMLVVYRHCLA